MLTGPSGGGKSTLTRVVNGLVPSFYEGELTGTVRLFGREVDDIPSWERGLAAGNVFQDPRSQFFANEVAGEIAFGCENYGLESRADRRARARGGKRAGHRPLARGEGAPAVVRHAPARGAHPHTGHRAGYPAAGRGVFGAGLSDAPERHRRCIPHFEAGAGYHADGHA